MALADDLLTQAFELALLNLGEEPIQANLRRAVSAAYYAAFHLLISEATYLLAPARPPVLAQRIARSFQHGEMKQVCISLLRKPLPETMQSLLPNPISSTLAELATSFIDLQHARQTADYDLSVVLIRDEVLTLSFNAQIIFSRWQQLRGTDEGNVFLSALAFGSRWSR